MGRWRVRSGFFMGRFGWVMFMLGGRGWIGRDREEGEEGGVDGKSLQGSIMENIMEIIFGDTPTFLASQ